VKIVTQQRAQELAKNLEQMLVTFEKSYLGRRKHSLEALLITFDIVHAGSSEISNEAGKGHRKMLISASEAFDARVPLHIAKERMRLQLLGVIYEIIQNEGKEI